MQVSVNSNLLLYCERMPTANMERVLVSVNLLGYIFHHTVNLGSQESHLAFFCYFSLFSLVDFTYTYGFKSYLQDKTPKSTSKQI